MYKRQLLTKADKAEEMKAIAEKVIVDNQSVSLPYSALAQAAFADGAKLVLLLGFIFILLLNLNILSIF